MPRRPRDRNDLNSLFLEQWSFLRKSCDDYDRGDESEAKRIASTLRLLLHDGKRNTQSLLGQLGWKDILFFDTAEDVDPNNLLPTFGLASVRAHSQGVRYEAPRENVGRPIWLIPFEYWWRKRVITIPDSFSLTRERLVRVVADQDGGAHVDSALDEDYYQLTQENALGFVATVNGMEYAIPHIASASVRQIAHEVLVSLVARHRMIPPDLPDEEPAPVLHIRADGTTGATKKSWVTPVNRCMCNSGLEYRSCHARGGANEGKIVRPRSE